MGHSWFAATAAAAALHLLVFACQATCQLDLAQPPASWCRLISRLHGSFGEHFFEGVDAFWGPSCRIGIVDVGAGHDPRERQSVVLDKTTTTRHGPQLIPSGPLQAPTKKKTHTDTAACSDGSPLSPSSPPESPWANGTVLIFAINLHQAPQNFGEVPSSSKHENFFSPDAAHHPKARLPGQAIHPVLSSGVILGLSIFCLDEN